MLRLCREMPTAREALGAATKIVADTGQCVHTSLSTPSPLSCRTDLSSFSCLSDTTGDLDSIKALAPVDATTNPSLILAAVSDPKFSALVDEAIKSAQGSTTDEKVCA